MPPSSGEQSMAIEGAVVKNRSYAWGLRDSQQKQIGQGLKNEHCFLRRASGNFCTLIETALDALRSRLQLTLPGARLSTLLPLWRVLFAQRWSDLHAAVRRCLNLGLSKLSRRRIQQPRGSLFNFNHFHQAGQNRSPLSFSGSHSPDPLPSLWAP